MSFYYNIELLNSSLTYAAYRQNISDILARPPGDEHAVKMRGYIVTNSEIMDEYSGGYKVPDSLKVKLGGAPATIWVVLTEGWCADAAYNLPIFNAIEKALPHKVRLCIFPSDSYPEMLTANLTDGGRSIPKVIILNEELKELGSWGPRPAGLQTLMKEWKKEGLGLKEIISKVHDWYKTDASQSLLNELARMVEGYIERHVRVATF